MGILELNSYNHLATSFSVSLNLNNNNNNKYIFPAPTTITCSTKFKGYNKHLKFSRGKIRAFGTLPNSESDTSATSQEPPTVKFAFVSSVLLPDGTPDVQYRKACGGQKLRDIMLDANVELYGPYARPLLNCGGGGTCGTCIVEVVEGRELLTPRTQKEKEKLQRNPRTWRLACQAMVGKPDSTGLVVVQQLPEWKGHEWNYGKEPPPEDATCYYL
ncbi:hypothetical protein ACH5RR_008041 [Cinchona calisaya]|uniref:2Fe-2S ferredoxin-type domain-containing protein n=1 Tax=Cinchona calisaya TaxID=153742 RepID=A0ABD3AAG7_9GENT